MSAKMKSLLMGVGLALLVGTILVYTRLPESVSAAFNTPKDDYLSEIGKILASGLIVGVVGVWVQKVFEDNAQKKRENELAIATEARKADEARAALRQQSTSDVGHLQRLFQTMTEVTRAAASKLHETQLSALPPNFDGLFSVGASDFETLLGEWQAWEQPAAQDLRDAYETLKASYATQHGDQAFIDDARKTVAEWSEQFSQRAIALMQLELSYMHPLETTAARQP